MTVGVLDVGGRAVSVGDLLSEAFSAEPHVMFSKDRFHPSPAGYARVAAALLPTVSAALDLFGERSAPIEPNLRRGESVGPVAKAATKAVTQPGTEVAPAVVAGQSRGAQGRWAVLLHRIRPAVPLPGLPGSIPTVGSTPDPTPYAAGSPRGLDAAAADLPEGPPGSDDPSGRMTSGLSRSS
jgi:hypothetical protein